MKERTLQKQQICSQCVSTLSHGVNVVWDYSDGRDYIEHTRTNCITFTFTELPKARAFL